MKNVKKVTVRKVPANEALELLKISREVEQLQKLNNLIESLENALIHLPIDRWEYTQLMDLLQTMRNTPTKKFSFFKTSKS